jgi:sodium transport system permease protein
LFIVILTALFFTTILTIISTYAKSVKEATSLSTPLTMIVMVIGMTGMMSTTANANPFMYLIPIYNSIQMFTGILNQSIDILAVVFTIISNVICISSGVFLLTKMFDNEKIMFNK